MLSRYHHLLLPVDFSEKNRSVLNVALEVAKVNQARLTLLHVIETLDLEDEDVQELYQSLNVTADRELDTLAQPFLDAGIETEYKIRMGNRVREIVRYAHERQVDLILMRSHLIDPEQPGRSIATISFQVSILSPCSILLVKQPEDK